jgi:putative membrane protein
MSERSGPRRPATFKLDDPHVVVVDPDDETGRLARGSIRITPEMDSASLPVPIEEPPVPARKGFRWGTLFWTSLGGLVVLGTGLGIVSLIDDLFARSEGLGFLGLALTALLVLASIVIAAREIAGLARLASIEDLHRRALGAIAADDRSQADAVVRDLVKLAHDNPHLARARAALRSHGSDIIDGADMVRLAERELMTPLDQEARRLVSAAAQRVSIVTAVSAPSWMSYSCSRQRYGWCGSLRGFTAHGPARSA